MMNDEIKIKLEAAFKRVEKGNVSISNVKRLTGGAAAATYRLDFTSAGQTQPLILRMAQEAEQFGIGLDKAMEGKVQSAAVAKGVVAAKILLFLNTEDGLGEGFVMECIEGETIPQKILREDRFQHARDIMAQQCGEILAAIHNVPLAQLDGLQEYSAQQLIAQLKSDYRSYQEVIPIFDYAFWWLENNPPMVSVNKLVHGDFRNGNLIVNEQGIAAVLDWELAHIGDPMEDLGWLCVNSWRFGNRNKPVGGAGSRVDLYDSYESATGVKVDSETVRFWELFGVLKWGVVCQYMASLHTSGEDRSVERAAIGRRVSETEIDIVDLLLKGDSDAN